MKQNLKQKLISLKESETNTSRFMIWWVSLEAAVNYSATQIIAFGRGGRDKSTWDQLLVNDLIICLAFNGNQINRYAYQISGKAIAISDPSSFSVDKPYLLYIKQVGFGERTSVKGAAFFQSELLPFTSRPIFQELWEECYEVDVKTPENRTQYFDWASSQYKIRLASYHDDYSYVVSAAAYHPFGPRRASITLVAEDDDDHLVGAILLELEADMRRYHRIAVRLFRSDYPWIRDQAVHIARIYSSPSVARKWELHRALLRTAITIAPSLVSEPISLIQGISYDYHPVAVALGFNVEIPQKLEDSFYYWKEFNLPPRLIKKRNKATEKESIHTILKIRKKLNYWLALGTSNYISIGFDKRAWALHRYPVNTGRWRQVETGHVVFLMSEDKLIRGYGLVVGTAIRNVEGLERFPLWIDFHPDMVGNVEIDISKHLSGRWFSQVDNGGIIPLPEEFGARLKRAADSLKMEGRMWVEPNPYLLHQTEFQVTKGQVFIVQSWSFRDKVLPVIRDILNEAGFVVKFAGDREGQVVFEIIWQLLNESEIVLVDFTDRRPNVYLEYGMALVLGKPIIAITQDQADIPSDTPNLKYIVYKDELGNTALKNLPQKIKDTIADIQNLKDKRVLSL